MKNDILKWFIAGVIIGLMGVGIVLSSSSLTSPDAITYMLIRLFWAALIIGYTILGPVWLALWWLIEVLPLPLWIPFAILLPSAYLGLFGWLFSARRRIFWIALAAHAVFSVVAAIIIYILTSRVSIS